MIRAAFVAALLLAAPALAHAQGRPQIPPPNYNPAQAAAGAYAIDPHHTTVQARVRHMGLSWSTFRFLGVSGNVTVDPARPTASNVDVTVDARTIQTFSREFETELQGDHFLHAAADPNIRFVSRSAVATDATHGRLTGDLTFRGVTRPATMEVEFLGANAGMGGHPRIAFHGEMTINPVEFGLTAFQNAYSPTIVIVADVEAQKS